MQDVLPNEKTAYGLIYCTTNLINGKKYIGQTAKKNNFEYIGSGLALHNAIKKYGRENFQKEILQYCIDKEDLNESEIYWIDYFGADKSDLFYNIATGGKGGAFGKLVNEKISLSLIGHKCSKETRKKISRSNTGRRHSEESKLKMSISRSSVNNPLWGIKRSKSVIDKILKKVVQHPIIQIDPNSGECIEWSSLNAAFKDLKIDGKTIWKCLHGKNFHCRGYFWLYKRDIIDKRINWVALKSNYENRDRIPRKPELRQEIFLFKKWGKKRLRNSKFLKSVIINKIDFNTNEYY